MVMGKMVKAVILAAGKGTRMLDITKGYSKEMLLLNNKPIIDYSIEEALKEGCSEICVVTNKSKKDLNQYLEGMKNKGLPVRVLFREPNGIMDAINSTKEFVKNDNFILMLPDTICLSNPSPTRLLINEFSKRGKPAICLMRNEPWFGKGFFVDIKRGKGSLFKIKGFTRGEISDLKVFGRYILTPRIFSYISQDNLEESEVGLLNKLIEVDGLYGVLLESCVFDTGVPEGYVRAKKSIENKI